MQRNFPLKSQTLPTYDSLFYCNSLTPDAVKSAKQLHLLIDVINQTVGDALSDLLLVETVLHAFGWSVSDWDAAYTDLPNRQMKVLAKINLNLHFFKL